MADNAFSSGVEVAQQRELARQRQKQAEDLKGLEFLKTFRPMLEEASAIEDQKTRTGALGDLMAGYARQFGQKVDKDTLGWMTKNPEQFQAVLQQAHDEGLRVDQIFPLLSNPMVRGSVTIALEKAKRHRTASGALGGDVPDGATAPQPAMAPNPQEAQTGLTEPAGATPAPSGSVQPAATPAPATPEQSPLVAPTAATEARAIQLETQRDSLRKRVALVARIDSKNPGLQILNSQLKDVEDKLFKLREEPALGEAKQANEPAPPEDIREVASTNPELRPKLRVGMTRGELATLLAKPASAAPATGTAAPTVNGPSETGFETPAAPAKVGPQGGVRTEAERTAEKDAIARREQKLPEDMLREPEINKRGITTQGQFEDAKAKGELPIRTVENVEGAKAAERDKHAYALKRMEVFSKTADEARMKRSQLEVIGAMYRQIGPTGKIVGPFREAILNTTQLFGLEPEKLSKIQTMNAAAIQLVRATLKDFSGNDSDRDVLTALQGSPSNLKTPAANQAVLALSLAQAQRDELRAANARKWMGQFSSLANQDPGNGKTFEEAWDAYSRSLAPIVDDAMLREMGMDRAKVNSLVGKK